MTNPDTDLPLKLLDLLDELDQEVRSLPATRALSRRGLSPKLAALTVEGLRLLLDGQSEQAARVLEAVSEELRDRTVSME